MFKFWTIVILLLFYSATVFAQEDTPAPDHTLIDDLPHQQGPTQSCRHHDEEHHRGHRQGPHVWAEERQDARQHLPQ